MAEVISTSAVPFRVAGLALILDERRKNERMNIYSGNIMWSLLASLFGAFNQKCDMLSYGEYHEMVFEGLTIEEVKARRQERAENEVKEIKMSVINMMNAFLPAAQKNSEETKKLKERWGL